MKKIFLRWFPVILWMGIIFIFSSQNGNESSQNNKFVVELLRHMGISMDKIDGVDINFIIRKLAHMTEYLILFLLIYRGINGKTFPIKALIFSLLLVFLYACTDEYHQAFIPGRGPSFRDVMIDTSGGSIGLLITGLVINKKKLFRRD